MPQIDLSKKFPNMTPTKSAPTLWRVNGCGVAIYGKRDLDPETNTYVATWCISLLFLPVLALRAYRVARAPKGGWYFIGREPLSFFAKVWNAAVIAAVVAVIAGVQLNLYLNSPTYKAKQQMAAANALVEQGQLAKAAGIYQTLAIGGAGGGQGDNAVSAVKQLLDTRVAAAPLNEAAGVITAAAQIARNGKAISTSDVSSHAMKLSDAKGATDPKLAVSMLDTIRPLVIDTRPVDTRRLALLQQWAKREPNNLDVIVPLASVLEEQNQIKPAKDLLVPVKDKLGDGEGARVLGTILGREGDYDGAYALLWPYVKNRLDTLHAAESTEETTEKQIWDREVQALRDEKGPKDFYDHYKDASEDEQHAMVQKYVGERIKNDPQYTQAMSDLEHAAAVVPVALDLGIVMLQRAQEQPDAGARKSQLEAAEKVFLAIGGVAGETDEYRLSLAKVDYWLGKQAEGRKLFDEFLGSKNRDYKSVLQVAASLRSLGATPEARTMAEEAYNKASKNEERYDAAMLRALCQKDLDDEIDWLNKCDTQNPQIKAQLAKASGDRAFRDGHDDEAVRQYQAAIDAYTAMPRTVGTLNESALAYYALFQANGDHQALERCNDQFQQAVDLNPSDSILLYNAGYTLLSGAVADLIGNDIDLRALHQTGEIDQLTCLYKDQAGRDAVVARFKAHPGIQRALSYLQKAMVVSPKHIEAAELVYSIHRFTHDVDAMIALEPRVRAADLDYSDQLSEEKEYFSGAKDEKNRADLAVAVKRSQEMADKLRPRGGRTAAMAIDHLVEQLMGLDGYDGRVDADQVEKLAEEARRIDESASTDALLTAAYLFHAEKDLRKTDKDFDQFCAKYRRSLGVSDMLAVAAGEAGSSYQQNVLQDAHVRQALAMLKNEATAFPDSRATYEWAMLKTADPGTAAAAAAAAAADVIRRSPRERVEHTIELLLHPYAGNKNLEMAWLMQINGAPDDAQATLKKARDAGVPIPPIRP
jgi:hypothetical protein